MVYWLLIASNLGPVWIWVRVCRWKGGQWSCAYSQAIFFFLNLLWMKLRFITCSMRHANTNANANRICLLLQNCYLTSTSLVYSIRIRIRIRIRIHIHFRIRIRIRIRILFAFAFAPMATRTDSFAAFAFSFAFVSAFTPMQAPEYIYILFDFLSHSHSPSAYRVWGLSALVG